MQTYIWLGVRALSHAVSTEYSSIAPQPALLKWPHSGAHERWQHSTCTIPCHSWRVMWCHDRMFNQMVRRTRSWSSPAKRSYLSFCYAMQCDYISFSELWGLAPEWLSPRLFSRAPGYSWVCRKEVQISIPPCSQERFPSPPTLGLGRQSGCCNVVGLLSSVQPTAQHHSESSLQHSQAFAVYPLVVIQKSQAWITWSNFVQVSRCWTAVCTIIQILTPRPPGIRIAAGIMVGSWT